MRRTQQPRAVSPKEDAATLRRGEPGLFFYDILKAKLQELNPGVVTSELADDIIRRLDFSHLIEFFYGVTWNLDRKNIFAWKHQNKANYEAKVKAFFEPRRILDMLKDWILFYVNDDELRKTVQGLNPMKTRNNNAEAIANFRAQVASWAERVRVKPRQVRVQRMRRKWASCSTRGTVSFSRDLLAQPEDFREYVIVHELLNLKRLGGKRRRFRVPVGWQCRQRQAFDPALVELDADDSVVEHHRGIQVDQCFQRRQ